MECALCPPVITGVVVCYNPEADMLRSLIAAVLPQVTHLVLVDNGSEADLVSTLGDAAAKVEFVALKQNYGIARAQNVGIERARGHQARYVLLLDQDSLPSPDMIAVLAAAVEDQERQGIRVACVGPYYTDTRQHEAAPFVKLRGLALERQKCLGDSSVVDVDFLIASGSLVPVATLDAVGLMTEELFIDWVDIEWGLRAQHLGFKSLGICAAHMEHALGDTTIPFRNRKVSLHSPLRHYYQIRNAIWLCKRRWLSRKWKLVLLRRVIRQMLFFSVFAEPRLQHASMMITGLIDGIINRMGKKTK